jgi:hypothetical protein
MVFMRDQITFFIFDFYYCWQEIKCVKNNVIQTKWYRKLRPIVTIKVFLVKVLEGFLAVTTDKENFEGLWWNRISSYFSWNLDGLWWELTNQSWVLEWCNFVYKQKAHGKNGGKSWICRMASKTKKVWTNDMIEKKGLKWLRPGQ